MSCSVCGTTADVALSITHDECGHRTHADCLPETYNFDLCGSCEAGPQEPHQEVRSHRSLKAEPRTTDGINYILNPGRKVANSTIVKVASWVPGLGSRFIETISNTQSPEFLLRHRMPIAEMMETKKMGLEHCLKAGVNMDDFLTNQYTWDDLLQFEDISGKRGMGKLPLQAITMGLQANANHFKMYPDAFPYDKVRAHTKFEPYELGELFGLYFPENGDPLQCEGNEDWNARDCANMGLSMDDLFTIGLETREQYDHLMMGLNKAEAVAAQKKLGVTQEHLKSLYVHPSEKVVESPIKSPVVEQPKPKAPPKKPVVQPIEEECEDEHLEEEEEVRPEIRVAIVPPIQQRVHQPPRQRLAKPTSSPAAANARRFDRHGALLYTKK